MATWPQLTQSSDSAPTATRLRKLLEDAVERCPADGILLSGGLDTSILSALCEKQGRRLKAVCVRCRGCGEPGRAIREEGCGDMQI